MKGWQHLWRFATYLPGKYSLMILLRIGVFMISLTAIALLTREFFNSLSGDAQVGFGTYTIVALLVGVTIGRVIVVFADFSLYYLVGLTVMAVVRTNMFAHILDRPGAGALPASP